VAFVWLTAYPLLSLTFAMRYAFAAFDITPRLYLKALWPAARATLVMAAAVLTIALFVTSTWPLPLVLLLKCAVGAAVYIVLVWYLHRDRLRAFRAMVRGRRPQEGEADVQAGT
jgi:hypothetical protein